MTENSEQDDQYLWSDIDWWVTEKPNTAVFYAEDAEDAADSNKKVFIHNLLFPIRRHGEIKPTKVLIDREIEINELLVIIYKFYQSPIVKQRHKVTDDEKKMRDFYDRDIVNYIDLITQRQHQGRESGDTEGPYATDKPDRHPLMCSGLVRFECLRKIGKNGSYEVCLGS